VFVYKWKGVYQNDTAAKLRYRLGGVRLGGVTACEVYQNDTAAKVGYRLGGVVWRCDGEGLRVAGLELATLPRPWSSNKKRQRGARPGWRWCVSMSSCAWSAFGSASLGLQLVQQCDPLGIAERGPQSQDSRRLPTLWPTAVTNCVFIRK
jgi:hypothetical protein